jgi:four helix bundle protein
MQDFRRLRVAARARVLIRSVYVFTRGLPSSEQIGLSSQMRRAAVSIGLNIVEGCSRSTTKEFIRYLEIARGSALEVKFALLVTEDLGMGKAAVRERVAEEVNHVVRELSALITSLRSRMMTGNRR